MRSAIPIIATVVVVAVSHAAIAGEAPHFTNTDEGSKGMGRLFDGGSTYLPGSGFVMGSFDADPAIDVMCGGANELVLLRATPSGLFVRDGSIPVSGPFTPLAVARMDDDAFPDVVGITDVGVAVLYGAPVGFDPDLRPIWGAPSKWNAIGDVDGDGRDDLVAASTDGITVFLNRGPAFMAITSPAGLGYGGLTLGDLDGDGDLELITYEDYYSPILAVFRHIGGGHLEHWKDIPVSWSPTLFAGDLDRDGSLDIVVGSGPSILWNNGHGDFLEEQPLGGAYPHDATELAIGDLNGDQMPDLVSLENHGSDYFGEAHLYPSLGRRVFHEETHLIACNGGGSDYGVRIEDVDSDGLQDVLVVQDAIREGMLTLFRGRAHSVPGERGYNIGDSGLGEPYAVKFDNLERDAVLVVTRDSALYYESWPDGTLRAPVPLPVAIGFRPIDLDGDGRDDLVRSAGGEIVTRLYLGGLNFSAPETLRYGDLVDTEDLNGDGTLDLLVEDEEGLRGVPGVGAGRFGLPGSALETVHARLDVALSDLDGDGAVDLASLETIGDEWHLMIYRNDGAMLFGLWNDVRLMVPYDKYHDPLLLPRTVEAIDFDGDAHPDIAVCYRFDNHEEIHVARGLGDGQFGFVDTVYVGYGEDQRDTFADLDGDGLDEVIVAEYTSLTAYLRIWANRGGAFEAQPFTINTHGYLFGVHVGDFDGDGALDLFHMIERRLDYERNDVFLHMNRLMHIAAPTAVSPPPATVPGPRLILRSNPSRDPGRISLVITPVTSEPIEITVHDLQGRRIAAARRDPRTVRESEKIDIETSTPMRAGIYWATARQGTMRATVKVVRFF